MLYSSPTSRNPAVDIMFYARTYYTENRRDKSYSKYNILLGEEVEWGGGEGRVTEIFLKKNLKEKIAVPRGLTILL